MRDFQPEATAAVVLPSDGASTATAHPYAVVRGASAEIEAAAKTLDAMYLEAQRGDARVTWQEVAAAGLKLRQIAFGRGYLPGQNPECVL